MLAPIQGQHTNALERAVSSGAPCSTAAPTNQSDRYGGLVRPESSGQPDEDPTNARPGGARRGRRTLGCPRLDRPARTSSNAMKMKEEHHVEIGKARVEIKGKNNER